MIELPPGVCHVWELHRSIVDDGPDLHHACLKELPADELERHARFRFPKKRNEFLLGKLMTRRILSFYHERAPLDWQFREGVRGKPEALDCGDLRFNLSHTNGLLALALVRGAEIGVDVELIEPRDAAVAERFFAPEEVEAVRAAPPRLRDRLFARFWTLKESYIKAHGDGLSIPLASFRFLLEEPVRIAFRDGGDPAEWWFTHREPPGGEHALAVAVHTRGPMRAEIRYLSTHEATIPLSRALHPTK